MNRPTFDDLIPSDDFDADNPAHMARFARLTGQPTGTGDGTPADLLISLRALHAEMQRRRDSHRMLALVMNNHEQNRALFADPGPLGDEARHLADRIHMGGWMVGIFGVAHFRDPEEDARGHAFALELDEPDDDHADPGPDADRPCGPTAIPEPTDRTDDERSDRASSPASKQGATSSAKSPAAPCHPAANNAHEVLTS